MNSLPCPVPPVLLVLDTQTTSAAALSAPQWRLAPGQPAQMLAVRKGETTVLEATHGSVWVTCDGWLEDYFLRAGTRLRCTGPLRLRVSAEDGATAQLQWTAVHANAGVAATLPPQAAASASPRGEATGAGRGAVSAA